jgi:hypothetical protein
MTLIEIRDMLEYKLHSLITNHAHLVLVVKFANTKPKDGEPFGEYFGKLIDIWNQFMTLQMQ